MVEKSRQGDQKEEKPMIEIKQYMEEDRDEVIELVLHCQNDGTRPIVTVDDQPELLHIKEDYMASGGNFWVAKENGRLVGSIGLMNCGDGIAVLKKFFTYEPYRSSPHHLGSRLYGKLLEFAKERGFKLLLLDTPKNTDRAHKFYEAAGFKQIEEQKLPVMFDHPYSDSDFFCLHIDEIM